MKRFDNQTEGAYLSLRKISEMASASHSRAKLLFPPLPIALGEGSGSREGSARTLAIGLVVALKSIWRRKG